MLGSRKCPKAQQQHRTSALPTKCTACSNRFQSCVQTAARWCLTVQVPPWQLGVQANRMPTKPHTPCEAGFSPPPCRLAWEHRQNCQNARTLLCCTARLPHPKWQHQGHIPCHQTQSQVRGLQDHFLPRRLRYAHDDVALPPGKAAVHVPILS